jgi:hypothetical protein
MPWANLVHFVFSLAGAGRVEKKAVCCELGHSMRAFT